MCPTHQVMWWRAWLLGGLAGPWPVWLPASGDPRACVFNVCFFLEQELLRDLAPLPAHCTPPLGCHCHRQGPAQPQGGSQPRGARAPAAPPQELEGPGSQAGFVPVFHLKTKEDNTNLAGLGKY